MKLYNLFEEVILEEKEKYRQRLSEGVSSNDVNMAINGDETGKHFHVSFNYRSPRGDTSTRWVQVYDYARTISGNDAISAFEISKNNVATGAWKIFRLDRIDSFKISKVPFYRPISDIYPNMSQKYNKTGNNTPSIDVVNNKAKFDYKYKSGYKPEYKDTETFNSANKYEPIDKRNLINRNMDLDDTSLSKLKR
jgi:hypothetical protein